MPCQENVKLQIRDRAIDFKETRAVVTEIP